MMTPEKIEQTAQHSILRLLSKGSAVLSVRKRIGDNSADIADKAISQITLLGIRLSSDVSFNLRYKKHIIFEHRVFNVRGFTHSRHVYAGSRQSLCRFKCELRVEEVSMIAINEL
jgi:hypothetical protein